MNKTKISPVQYIFIAILLKLFIFPTSVCAVCPICTVAVVGGLGLSRWLRIDDLITGIWLGGLIMSISLWSLDWIYTKYDRHLKKLKKEYVLGLLISIWYCVIFIPLNATNLIGHPMNKLFGIDKLLCGSLIGSLIFTAAVGLDNKIRKVQGKQLFNYQKVAIPVISLIIISLIAHLLNTI